MFEDADFAACDDVQAAARLTFGEEQLAGSEEFPHGAGGQGLEFGR